MKKQVKRWIAVILSICIWTGCMIPLHASDALEVSFSPENITVSQSTSAQTVTMKLQLAGTQNISAVGYYLICDTPIQVQSVVIGNVHMEVERRISEDTQTEYYVSGSDSMTTDHVGEITFQIPANTEQGNYNIVLETKDGGGVVVGTLKTISAQTAIRVTESAAETGSFTATLSGDTSVTVGENVEMDITVSGSDFAAAAFSLTYDTALLELASADGFDCSDTNGKVTVVDFGTTKEAPYTYHVTFRAISDGTAAVTLTEASFGSSGSAETDNMTSAEIASQSVAVTIEKRKFSVSLPDIFAGDDTVIDGQTYTFEATDAIHYNYGTVTATMGGGSSFTVTPGEDGSYSIANVTGNLVIQGSRTAKQYRVTFQTDTDAELPVDEVIVYGTDFSETKDYVFVVPEEDNYKVSVTSVTCNGEPVEFTRDNNTVTISGDTICGDLVVKLDRTRINADVTVDGNASGELTIHSSVAVPGTDYSVTLNADPRYTYTVTATVNGKAVILTKAGNVYTIDGDDVKLGEIIFTVEKTLNVNFDISEYLAFDGTMVWLVQNKVEQVENTVYTYAGQNMLWSEAYDSYCCLVIASTSQDITADKLAFRSGTTDSVDYGKDVNASGKVDMNDAQLVYNLYQAVYESFTDTVTMEKVLCADVNGDGKVDTEDAVAIVAEILG